MVLHSWRQSSTALRTISRTASERLAYRHCADSERQLLQKPPSLADRRGGLSVANHLGVDVLVGDARKRDIGAQPCCKLGLFPLERRIMTCSNCRPGGIAQLSGSSKPDIGIGPQCKLLLLACDTVLELPELASRRCHQQEQTLLISQLPAGFARLCGSCQSVVERRFRGVLSRDPVQKGGLSRTCPKKSPDCSTIDGEQGHAGPNQYH